MPAANVKGGDFERGMAKVFSLWWSGGDDDDVFYRTEGSGGRATNRARFGKKTKRCGDLGANDSDGQPFVKFVAVEFKKGYNKATFADILDRPDNLVPQPLELMIDQAYQAHVNSGSYYWMLIHQRDRREPLVYCSWGIVERLAEIGSRLQRPGVFARVKIKVGKEEWRKLDVGVMQLRHFLGGVDPEDIRTLIRKLKKENGHG